MRIIRPVLLALAAALLVYGVFWERHKVRSRPGGEARELSGFGLTEAATVDGIVLEDGTLYDRPGAPGGLSDGDERGPKEAPSKPACPT